MINIKNRIMEALMASPCWLTFSGKEKKKIHEWEKPVERQERVKAIEVNKE